MGHYTDGRAWSDEDEAYIYESAEKTETTQADDYETISRSALNRLYAIAYHDGHNDTVEGRYTDVLSCDMDTYHEDSVQTFLDEL